MKIKEVKASIVLDSRGEETIAVEVNNCETISPSGTSVGQHERKCYLVDIASDVEFMSYKINVHELPQINEFEDLEKIESKFRSLVGANTLFAFEASILKALAREKKISLWKLLNSEAKIFPRILSNTIGGGSHTLRKVKPDFQEFLITSNKNPAISKMINHRANEEAGKIILNLEQLTLKKNYENAWQCDLDNEQALEVMKNVQENIFEESAVHVDLGLDVASSEFFKNNKYYYKNRTKVLSKEEQINYMVELIKKYNLFYVEDPLNEDDFRGFAEIVKQVNCLIVGDDLTVTNLERVEKAIKLEAITGLIVKPNQTGSLIEVKKIIDLCKKNGIKTIMSHRSGETLDNTIADLAFAWQCDFIKTSVVGPEREAKVNRLMEIEGTLKSSIEDDLKVKRETREVDVD
jgi:enolase